MKLSVGIFTGLLHFLKNGEGKALKAPPHYDFFFLRLPLGNCLFMYIFAQFKKNMFPDSKKFYSNKFCTCVICIHIHFLYAKCTFDTGFEIIWYNIRFNFVCPFCTHTRHYYPKIILKYF